VAAVFTLLNAVVLVIRLRAEVRALTTGAALSRAHP
jgi:isoprenylcysteine carboxyl methyltransferase (ICMT) family protein YpbQ